MQERAGMTEQALKALAGSPFIFPKVWQSSAWFGGMFFIMIGMLFILLITNEVQFKTHRQNIIDGWSRMDFLKAKLSVLIFFVLTATILVGIMGLLVGLVFSKSYDTIADQLYYVGYFALMATVYLMSAFLIAMLVKRTGLAIIIYFAFIILDTIIYLIFTLYDNWVGQVAYFLPLESTDSLITFPFKPSLLERRKVPDYTLIGAAIAYIVLLWFIIVRYFRNTDLKT